MRRRASQGAIAVLYAAPLLLIELEALQRFKEHLTIVLLSVLFIVIPSQLQASAPPWPGGRRRQRPADRWRHTLVLRVGHGVAPLRS
jgi:hypothetical protein